MEEDIKPGSVIVSIDTNSESGDRFFWIFMKDSDGGSICIHGEDGTCSYKCPGEFFNTFDEHWEWLIKKFPRKRHYLHRLD